jgi:carbon monoxide dehydrogenase subunit G
VSYTFTGDFTVPTSRDEVYAVLSDVTRFAPLLPTYLSHELKEDGSALVKVKVGVGKISGTGEVVLTAEETVAPLRARYAGKGKVMGGVFNLKAGFELEDVGTDLTRVAWQGEMAMFGKLVSLAGGVVKPVAEHDINRMIQAIQQEFGGVIEAAPAAVRPTLFARLVAWLKRLFKIRDRG